MRLSCSSQAVLWIGSVHVADPGKQALIWIALGLDLFGGVTWIFLLKGLQYFPAKVRDGQQLVRLLPATNIEHKIESTGSFVTLVFGYSVLALIYQSRAAMGVNAFFGKAVLALIQAFAIKWMYFEVDSFNLDTHAIRRHWISCTCSLSRGYEVTTIYYEKNQVDFHLLFVPRTVVHTYSHTNNLK